MKKVIKLRRILQKSKRSKKYLSKKSFSRKMQLKKKYLFQQIQSPHNTNDFLINNQSSAFYTDEEEDSIFIKPSSIIQLEDDTNSELDFFNLKNLDSTNEESMALNEKSITGKEELVQCVIEEKK